MKKKHTIRLQSDTTSVVGIVATVLIIGLLITVVGIIKTVHVPKWIEQKEAQHMNDVETQFTQLKYTLDLLALLEKNVAISNYVTLGSEEVPFINEGRTYDTLAISSDDFQINFSNATDTFSFPLSNIVFSSKNTYFVNQVLCLEAGALILSQTSNSILLGPPLISVSNFTNVSLSLFAILGLDGKGFVSGYGTYVLSNEFISRETYTMHDVTTIHITTLYPEAWGNFFNSSSFVLSGLTYTINCSTGNLLITYSDSLGSFHIDIINIRSQLAIWRH